MIQWERMIVNATMTQKTNFVQNFLFLSKIRHIILTDVKTDFYNRGKNAVSATKGDKNERKLCKNNFICL